MTQATRIRNSMIPIHVDMASMEMYSAHHTFAGRGDWYRRTLIYPSMPILIKGVRAYHKSCITTHYDGKGGQVPNNSISPVSEHAAQIMENIRARAFLDKIKFRRHTPWTVEGGQIGEE